jgi:hypothetical protein
MTLRVCMRSGARRITSARYLRSGKRMTYALAPLTVGCQLDPRLKFGKVRLCRRGAPMQRVYGIGQQRRLMHVLWALRHHVVVW